MTEPKDTDEQIDVDKESGDRPGAEFAAILRDYLDRDPRHLSYQDLAELTGLSKGYISLLAQGRRRPKPAVTERIGRALRLKAGEIALMIKASGTSIRPRGGRPPGFMTATPGFMTATPGLGPGEPLTWWEPEPIDGGGPLPPKYWVYPADRRGAIWLRAEATGPYMGYIAVEATNGPDFWITVTPNEPLQMLPIHADAATLKLGVDDGGKPRWVHKQYLGPHLFL
jgi:transcriptional regulator with XRE-family HTH domain